MNGISDNILPPRLKRGDTIGLAAPAGPVRDREKFATGVRLIREMGFEVKFAGDIFRSDGYLAGGDARRAEEFNTLWADPEVKGVLAARGGYGSLRMVDGIDMALIRRQPKILAGFSDITVLHTAVRKATGLVTFHTPTVSTLVESPHDAVTSLFATLTAHRPPEPIRPAGLEIIAGGNGRGVLLGGNLTNLVHLVGTPHELGWQGALLFVEDVGEAAYRIDRMLTHLKAAGRLDGLAGLLLGSFTGCDDLELVWTRAGQLLADSAIPVWAGMPVGHIPRNLTLPLGIEAEMDGATGTLRFTAPCTSGSA